MIKKTIIFLIIIYALGSPVYTELIARIHDPFKSPRIFVDDSQFYLFDRSSYQTHIYLLTDFKKIRTFGKKGEGPGEFKMNASIAVFKDYIFGTCTGKIMYFTKSGELIKEIKVPHTIGRLQPVGDRIAGGNYARFQDVRKPGLIKGHFCILTPGKDDLKDVYEYNSQVIIFRDNVPKQDFNMLEIMIWALSDGEHYIIGDPNKGLYFCFVNEAGEISRELNVPYEKQRITAAFRRKSLNDYKKRLGSKATDHARRFNYVYPEYLPAYNSFIVDKPYI